MMKCCNHCGALLEDDALACPHCGTAYESATAEPVIPQKVTEVSPKPATKKKISKKAIFFISGGVLVAVVAIMVLVNYLQFSALLSAVEHYEAIKNGDVEHLESLAPMDYWEKRAQRTYKTVDEYMDSRSGYIELIYGNKSETQSLEIVDWESVRKNELKDIKNQLQENYNIAFHRVKSAKRIIYKFVSKSSDHSLTYLNVMIAVQIDSEWYLISDDPSYNFVIYKVTNER